MFVEDWGRRVSAAAAIAVAHALALYALVVSGPQIKSTAATRPLTVHFVSQPESRPQWQPLRVSVVAPALLAPVPDMPLIEIPVASVPAERAISVSGQSSVAATREQDDSVPKLVSAVEYVREPEPRYPPQSRRLREQGLVVLRVLIDEQGSACSIEIETSSGHARLDDAAREAVARAAFRPYVEDGAPRRALVLIPIEFALNRSAV